MQNRLLIQAQLGRWEKAALDTVGVAEVGHLTRQSAELETASKAILGIAESISHSTIDRIMAMGFGVWWFGGMGVFRVLLAVLARVLVSLVVAAIGFLLGFYGVQ